MIDEKLSTDSAVVDQPEKEQNIVLRWWREGIGDPLAPSGPRAELRRAGTIEEIVFTQIFHDLRRRLANTGWRATDRLALVAGVLAFVRDHDGRAPFASQMAALVEGSKNRHRIPPSRFRRVLRQGDEGREGVFQQLRRIVVQLDARVNVVDLSRSLYWWNSRTRKDWALKYYEHVDERATTKE